jgi:uncharacterized membrane protein
MLRAMLDAIRIGGDRPSVATVHASAWSVDPLAVLTGCLVFALFQFLPSILNDGDTLWQIRAGEWMLDHRAIPATDPFSFTAGDRRWFPHEWLAEVLLGLAFRAGGMQGVMALAAAAIGFTAAVMMQHLRRFLPTIYALAALVIAFSNAAPSVLARPHLLAWPCLALWCGGLVAARAERIAPNPALALVMVVWVNLHGSFMVGLLLPFAFMVEALFDPGAERRRVVASWSLFILAASAAALLNPGFLAGVFFPFQMVRMTTLARIGEWQPTDFGTLQPLEVTILGGLALGLSGRARLPPIRLIILLILIHAALAHGRHEQLLGIVGALIVAEPFGRSLTRHAGAPPRSSRRAWVLAAPVLAAAALCARMALPLPPSRTGAAFAGVLDAVPPALRERPVLNDYSLGGELIFNGVRPFIDSRADLYGDAFVLAYQKMVAPDPTALERSLCDWGIAWTIFPADRPIVRWLDRQPGWHRLVAADGVVIHAANARPAC